MIKLFSFLFIFSFVFISSTFAESSRFVAGFEDIPLMKGLTQAEKENFSFGNEETRYIETRFTADKTKSFDDVKTFYKETLRQFGWRATKDVSNQLLLVRESDILEINKISVSPLKISIILKNRI